MNLFYVYDEGEKGDYWESFCLFDSEEPAKLLFNRLNPIAESPAMKEFDAVDPSDDGIYYFIHTREGVENKCFTSKEEAAAFCQKEGLLLRNEEDDLCLEIHGHKVNSFCCADGEIDETAEPDELEEDTPEYVFYFFVKELKEKGIEFEYFEYEDILSYDVEEMIDEMELD